VEAAGIEDMQGGCDNSLRDATLPRIGPNSLEYYDPASSLPVPCRTISNRGLMAT
jgi:hypothetical protein